MALKILTFAELEWSADKREVENVGKDFCSPVHGLILNDDNDRDDDDDHNDSNADDGGGGGKSNIEKQPSTLPRFLIQTTS